MVAAIPELHTWYGGCLAVADDGRVGAAYGFADEYDENVQEYRETDRLDWEHKDEAFAHINFFDKERPHAEWVQLQDLSFPIPQSGLINTPGNVQYRRFDMEDKGDPKADRRSAVRDVAAMLMCDSRRQFIRGFKLNRYKLEIMGQTKTTRNDSKVEFRVGASPLLRSQGNSHVGSAAEHLVRTMGSEYAHHAMQSLAFPSYPNYDEALGMVMAGSCSVALNHRYWVGLSSSRGDLVLGYYRSELAPLNPENGMPIISNNIAHLADEINELVGGDNHAH